MYDMRGVFYSLGVLAAKAIVGEEWPTELCRVDFVTPTASGLTEDDLVYRPLDEGLNTVLYTMSLAAKMAGKEKMYVMCDQFVNAQKPKGRRAYTRYLQGTLQTLLSDAISADAYGDGVFAFCRGLNCGIILRAHSDEGGWVREALIAADYPKPSGMVTPNSDVWGAMPHFGSHVWHTKTMTKSCITLMLECAAAMSDADPCHAADVQVETVLFNPYYGKDGKVLAGSDAPVDGGHCRPSAFAELKEVLALMEYRACGYFNTVHANSVVAGCNTSLQRNTFRSYFANDKVDRHLARADFMPYLYIEPACVLSADGYVVHDGPKAGTKRELPMFKGDVKVSRTMVQTTTRSGSHNASRIHYDYTGCSLRQSGFFYICSGAFNEGKDMGLSQMRFITNSSDIHDNMSLLRKSKGNVVDEVRWQRPQCPIPAVGEGKNWCGNTMLEYSGGVRRDIKTALPKEQLAVTVEVSQLHVENVVGLKGGAVYMSRTTNDSYRQYINDVEFDEEEALRAELFGASVTPVVTPVDMRVSGGTPATGPTPNDERGVGDQTMATRNKRDGESHDSGGPDVISELGKRTVTIQAPVDDSGGVVDGSDDTAAGN
jgi:hypothetical protein